MLKTWDGCKIGGMAEADCKGRPWRLLRRLPIPLPNVFQRLSQSLLFHCPIDMPGVSGEDELIVIALSRQRLGHVLVGKYPIVHIVAHHVRIEKIAVAHLHPDAYRLGRAAGNKVLMEFPSAVRSFGIGRPLLIDEGPRVSQHAVIKLGMIPGHDQCAGSTRTAAHGCSSGAIFAELYVGFGLNSR